MSDGRRAELDRDGFTVLRDVMSATLLHELRARVAELFEIEGCRAGCEFKQEEQTRRLANLVDKGEVFQRTIAMPDVLEYVSHVLGGDYKLSSLNIRSANPISDWVQPLHCDMGAIPDNKGFWVCNTVWLLDDFTADNGAVRAVPGSHRWGKLPQDILEDPTAQHPGELLVTAQAGSVIVMNAHLWHGGTANRTNAPRTAMHAFYARRDKPQQQYQKRLLRPEVQAQLTPQLRYLLALDDPLNDELSANPGQTSGFMK